MIIMGVDYGESRTGIAVCDKLEMMARPVTVINEKNFRKCTSKIAAMAKELNAEMIVVGLPKNMNNTIGERAEKCTKVGDILKKITNCEIVMWDERSTTVSAHNILNVTNTRGKERKSVVDELAATIILESYMAYRKNTKEKDQ